MIKNYFYFIVGILMVLFAATHAWNGQMMVLPALNTETLDTATRTTFFYVWHIMTIENLIFGIAFLIMAFRRDLSKLRFAAWTIALIMTGRWLVILGSTLARNKNGTPQILMDSVALLIIVGLILLGIRVKTKLAV